MSVRATNLRNTRGDMQEGQQPLQACEHSLPGVLNTTNCEHFAPCVGHSFLLCRRSPVMLSSK